MQAQFVEQNLLVFTRLCDAAFADFDPLACGQDDVYDADILKFFEDTSRFVAESGTLAQSGQCFPQHIRQEADENVCQHTVFFLVPDGSDAQVAFVNSERGLGFGQLDIGLPQFFIAPVGDVGSQQITAFAQLRVYPESVFL